MFSWFERRVNPYPETTPVRPLVGLLPFVWFCTKGLRGWIAIVLICAAIMGGFESVLFKLLSVLTDWLTQFSPEQFWQYKGSSLGWMLVGLLGSIFVVASCALVKYQVLQGNFPMLLRWNFHRLMLNQSIGFYQDEFAGRVSAKIMQTALAVRDTVMLLTDILVFISMYFLTTALVLGGFSSALVFPFILWLTGYISAICFFVPKLGKTAQDQADARSLMTGRITDAYANIATIKLFSHADREAAYAKNAMQEFMGTVYRQMRLVTQFEIINHSLSVLLIVSTTIVALLRWQEGLVTVGAVAAALAMSLRLNGMAHWIMWEVSMLFEHIGTVQDGMNILTRRQMVVDSPNAPNITVQQGAISFRDVGFYYDEKKPLLKHFNLTIQPGEKIGLVGRSGAGKSTLINLLLRFYDIQEGAILIDDQNIAQFSQKSLRAQIGMVTQDTSLLHRSVRENILYGRPDASENELYEASQRAQAIEFIETLADSHGRTGFDAHVGERGVKLSGGQRQRIAIARVMLKNAPILLLDEATSALDSEVESAIQSNLYKLMEGKTVIAIAHRLSTIAAMDRLIVIDEGQIVEQGSHHELLMQKGLYAKLWDHQSGGFLGD